MSPQPTPPPVFVTRRIDIRPIIAGGINQTQQQARRTSTYVFPRRTTVLPLLLCLLLCFSTFLGPLSSPFPFSSSSSSSASYFVHAENVQVNTPPSPPVMELAKESTLPISPSTDAASPSPSVAVPAPAVEQAKSSADPAIAGATTTPPVSAAETSSHVTTQTNAAPIVDSTTAASVASPPPAAAAPSETVAAADTTTTPLNNDAAISKDNATATTPTPLTNATTAVANASAPPSNESAIADVSSTVIPIPPPLTTLTAPQQQAALVAVQPAAVPQQAVVVTTGNANAVVATTTAAATSTTAVVDPSDSSAAVATPATAVAAVPAAPPAVVLVPVPVVAILPTIAEVKKEEIPRLDAYKQTVLEIVAEKKGKKKQKEEEDKKKKEVEDASIAAAAAAAAAVPVVSAVPPQVASPVATAGSQQPIASDPAAVPTPVTTAAAAAAAAIPVAVETVAAPVAVAQPVPSAGALAAAASIAAAVSAAAANLAAKTEAAANGGAAVPVATPVVAAPVIPAVTAPPPAPVAAPIHPAAIPRPPEEGAAASQRRDRFNYAAFDAGAKLLATSEGMKKGNSILIADDDRYMMVPCGNTHKYFVIQLSEDIIIDTIELANLEHYASSIKDFQILGSATHPTSSWLLLGSYTALDSTQKQVFTLPSKEWVRFIKLRWVSHYGDEYYCTLTYLRVYGTTMLETFREEMQKSEDEVKEFSLELSDIKPLGSPNTIKEEVPVAAAIPAPVAVPIPAVIPISTPALTITPTAATAVDPNVLVTVVPVIPVPDVGQSNQTLQPEIVTPIETMPRATVTEIPVEIPPIRQPSSPPSASPMPWVGHAAQSSVSVEVQATPTQATFTNNATLVNNTAEATSLSQVNNHTAAVNGTVPSLETVVPPPKTSESQSASAPAPISSNTTSVAANVTSAQSTAEVPGITKNATDDSKARTEPQPVISQNATSVAASNTTTSAAHAASASEVAAITSAQIPATTATPNVIVTPPPPAQAPATVVAPITVAPATPTPPTPQAAVPTPAPASTVTTPTPVTVTSPAAPVAAPAAVPVVPPVATPIVVPVPVASALSSISADPQLLADAQVIAERISNPNIEPPVQTKEAPPKVSGSTGSSSGSSGGGQQSIFKALTNRIKELEIHQALANNYVSDLADRYVNDMNGVKLKMEGMVLEMAAHMARNEKQWQEGWSMMNQTAQYVQADNQRVLQQMREQLEEAQTLVDLVEGIIQVQLGLTLILIIGYFLGRSLLSIARSLMKLVWVCLCKRSAPPQHNTHRKNRQSMSARSKSASNLLELIGDDPVLQQQILMMNNSTAFDPNDPVMQHSRKQSRANRRSLEHAGLPSPPLFHASSSEGVNLTGHDSHQRAMSVVMPSRSILRQQQNGAGTKSYRSMSLSNSVTSSPQFGGVNSMRRVNSYANTGSSGSLSPSVSFEQIAEQSHGEHDEFSLDALSLEQSKVTDSELQAMKEYDDDMRVRGVEPRRKNSGSQNPQPSIVPPATPSASASQTPAHKKRSSLGAGLMRLLSGSSSNLAALTSNASTTPPVPSGSPIAPDAANTYPVPGRVPLTPTLPLGTLAAQPFASQSDSALDLQPTVEVPSSPNAAASAATPLSPSLRDRRSTQPAPLLRGLISGVTATGALVAGGARLIASGIARARSNTASASNSPLKSKHPTSVASGSHSPASDQALPLGTQQHLHHLSEASGSLSADAKVNTKPRADSQPSIRIPQELLSASSAAATSSTSSSSSSSSSPVIRRLSQHAHGLSPLKLSEELGSGEHKSDSTSPSSSSSFAASIDNGTVPHTSQLSILSSPSADLSPIAGSPLPTPHGEAEQSSNGRFEAQFDTAQSDAREDGAPSFQVAVNNASVKMPVKSKNNSGRKNKSNKSHNGK